MMQIMEGAFFFVPYSIQFFILKTFFMKSKLLHCLALLLWMSGAATAQDIWTQKADFGGGQRYGALGLNIGDKGYMGTGIGNNNWQADIWEFDPIANVWTQKSDFPGGRRFGVFGLSIGNKGYIGGGSYTPGDFNWQWFNDWYEFDPANNTWTTKAPYGGQARYFANCFTINGKGYMGSGSYRQDRIHQAYYLNDFWEYDPEHDLWTRKADIPEQGRFAGIGMSIGDKGYIGLGFYYYDTRMFDFYEYYPAADRWTRKADYPGSGPVQAVAFTIGNRGYVGTGGNYQPYSDFWEYNPYMDKWTQKASVAGGVRQSATGFSIGNKGYIGIGSNSSDVLNDFWEYTPGIASPIPSIQFDPNTVTTLAGNGTAGFADGNGTGAQFNSPYGVVTDHAGNIYVADYYNHCIRKVTPGGVVSTLAGNGAAGFANGIGTAAQFHYPRGIAIDAAGNLYVADEGNHSIRKVTPAGEVSTLAGNGTAGFADGTGSSAQFRNPSGVTVDPSGNIFVTDYYNHSIRKITPSGAVTTIAGNGIAGTADGMGTAAQFINPRNLDFDAAGNLYVTEVYAQLRKISPSGMVTTINAPGLWGFQDGIIIDAADNIYITAEQDGSHVNIYKVTPDGTVSTFAGTLRGYQDGVGTNAKFNGSGGLAIDDDGNMYVGDNGNNRIRKISKPLLSLTSYAGNVSTAYPVGISGSNLLGDASITVPAGLEIAGSESGSYTNSLMVTPVSGSINSYQFYVRTAGNVAGGVYNYDITMSSPGTSAQILTVKSIVTDTTPPALVCPPAQVLCNNSNNTYTIPAISATDVSGIQSISYVITGATQRTGTGANASGTFNAGRNTITWTVKDGSGNTATCTTTARINTALTVTVPNTYPLLLWGDPNTIYMGFGPTCAILIAMPAGGTKLAGGNYQYAWSTGANSRIITVCPAVPGSYVYTVTITDSLGCTATASQTIKVVDVRCGQKLNKVLVCVPGKNGYTESCLTEGQALVALLLGGHLGSCSQQGVVANPGKATEESMIGSDKKITVFPNPNNGSFTVQMNNINTSEIRILDQNGRVVVRKMITGSGAVQSVQMSLGHLANGIYIVQAISSEAVFTTKMMVQQ